VPESDALESAARPDLPLLKLLRELSGGLQLSAGAADVERLRGVLDQEFPMRRGRASDAVDARVLAAALPRCRIITCDAFMADVVRRTRLDLCYGCELYTGRRTDVERLRARLEPLLCSR
jgi:hypothetical protein